MGRAGQVIELVGRVSNGMLSACAGLASFVLTLLAFLLLSGIDEQLAASFGLGLFALMVVWIALEKPNSRQARAAAALVQRLLAVKAGDLHSPAPQLVREEMPELAVAVEGLFTQVRSNLENVHAMALYDPVTSLPNRVHFRKEAERMLRARASGEILALLFVDLDGFKDVNDRLGHAVGDRILALVASRLRTAARAQSQSSERLHPLIARLAGDEFTLLFPAIAGMAEAERIARSVLASICEPYGLDGLQIGIGASIGVALCPEHGEDLTLLMRDADIAMYRAKSSGRSCVRFHDAGLAAVFEEESRLARAMAEAATAGDFTLRFQPQLCARSGSVVGSEALVHWDGLPGARPGFIPLSCDNDAAADVSEWAAGAIAGVIAQWRAEGPVPRLGLGVSPRQLRRPDFFGRLARRFGEAGAPLDRLELVLGTRAADLCGNAQIEEIAALRSRGLFVALEGFGDAACNPARLRDMPVDRIKLMEGLVAEVDTCPATRAILSSLVHLAHGLGVRVIAGGVERPQQLDVLRAIGCDGVQGSLVADPMAEHDYLVWLAGREDLATQAMSA